MSFLGTAGFGGAATFDFSTTNRFDPFRLGPPGAADGPLPDHYVSDPSNPGAHNVELQFVGAWTDTLKSGVIAAADTIGGIVLGDVPDIVADKRIVDDLRIEVTLEDLDGPGGTLAQAGPTLLRSAGGLPATGRMVMDAADADALAAGGGWNDVALHEMLHVLGFGTIWEREGLIGEVDGAPRYVGANGIRAYRESAPDIAAADPFADQGIPIETDGYAGTTKRHWDETLFGDELMTGFIGPDAALSDITVASLSDLGYVTTWDDTILG